MSNPRSRLVVAAVVTIILLGTVAMTGLLSRAGERPDGSRGSSDAGLLGTSPSIVSSASAATIEPGGSIQAGEPRHDATPNPSPGSPAAPTNDVLPGSPEIVLFQRSGDDVKVLGWRPGEASLTARQTVQDAVQGLDDKQDPQTGLSPDGSLLLVHAYPVTNGGADTFRLFRLEGTSGREIWQSTALGTDLAAGFLPTGQIVVTGPGLLRRDRGWTIVDASSDDVVVHDLDLPPFPAPPAPAASPDLDKVIFNYTPLGMSADGLWVFAASLHGIEPQLRPAYRISIETGDPVRIDAFPTTGPSRIVSNAIDAVSGRLLLAGPHTTSGPGLVQAWSTGATTPDFQAELGIVFFATWTDDGGVITADYDQLPGPFHFRVLSLSETGKVEKTYFVAEGKNAALLGVRNGFAAVYVASTDSKDRTLVVIRLSDGAISSVDVADPAGLYFTVGLRP